VTKTLPWLAAGRNSASQSPQARPHDSRSNFLGPVLSRLLPRAVWSVRRICRRRTKPPPTSAGTTSRPQRIGPDDVVGPERAHGLDPQLPVELGDVGHGARRCDVLRRCDEAPAGGTAEVIWPQPALAVAQQLGWVAELEGPADEDAGRAEGEEEGEERPLGYHADHA